MKFQGLVNVAVVGRVYHPLIDVGVKDHSMHWFLYDEAARLERGREYSVPEPIIDAVRIFLNEVNPYISTIRHAANEIGDRAASFAIELSILRSRDCSRYNLRSISPRQVTFFRNAGQESRFVPILSPQYEPLQYPLLFPHGTLGWGCIGNSLRLLPCTQTHWYRHLLPSERRFHVLGRLTCEYAVDMFSRAEEERLNYLKQGRRIQAMSVDEAADPRCYPGSFPEQDSCKFDGLTCVGI